MANIRFMQSLRPFDTGDRRVRLIGKRGESIFEIGSGRAYQVSENGEGELFCIANDVPFMRWNNKETVLNVIQKP